MHGLKTNTQAVRNIELIQTYYSGKKTPEKKKAIVFINRNIISSPVFWLTAAISILLGAIIAIAGYTTANKQAAVYNLEKTTAVSPSKYYSTIAYYDYQQLKGKNKQLILQEQKNCAAVNLDKITDLTNAAVSFSAMGEAGTERVAILLKDDNNNSNANRDDVILTPLLPNDRWQKFNVRFDNLYLPLDKSRVEQVRFDASSNLTKNSREARVYIKDISIE